MARRRTSPNQLAFEKEQREAKHAAELAERYGISIEDVRLAAYSKFIDGSRTTSEQWEVRIKGTWTPAAVDKPSVSHSTSSVSR